MKNFRVENLINKKVYKIKDQIISIIINIIFKDKNKGIKWDNYKKYYRCKIRQL